MSRTVPLVAAAVFVAVVVAVGVARAIRGSDSYRGSEPPAGVTLPRFALRDVSGARVDSRSLQGKVVVVTFLDSHCRASCPLIAAHLARAVKLLDAAERRHVAMLAITTDPRGDTPRSVRAFLVRSRASGRLAYLLGSERELRRVWRAFAVLPSLDTGRHEVHSAPVRIYDRDGRWVSTQNAGVDLSAANVAHDVRLAGA